MRSSGGIMRFIQPSQSNQGNRPIDRDMQNLRMLRTVSRGWLVSFREAPSRARASTLNPPLLVVLCRNSHPYTPVCLPVHPLSMPRRMQNLGCESRIHHHREVKSISLCNVARRRLGSLPENAMHICTSLTCDSFFLSFPRQLKAPLLPVPFPYRATDAKRPFPKWAMLKTSRVCFTPNRMKSTNAVAMMEKNNETGSCRSICTIPCRRRNW
ncbi:hypothetical protein F4778DRAFT_691524 [Xylariomycetidae sp. FL2044]|nr:hypothetical protein F4778DRAFT_691524 [Xylariomycetidae sp. FL2044]